MGNFYTNITILDANEHQIVHQLEKLNRKSLVSPPDGKQRVVFLAEDRYLFETAEALSQSLDCVTIAIHNHDDSILMMNVYQHGELLDEYNSAPSYFDGPITPPSGGNADQLIKLLAPDSNAKELETLLRGDIQSNPGEMAFVFAVMRHQSIAEILGLTKNSVGIGYEYLLNESAEGLNLNECVSVN